MGINRKEQNRLIGGLGILLVSVIGLTSWLAGCPTEFQVRDDWDVAPIESASD